MGLKGDPIHVIYIGAIDDSVGVICLLLITISEM